jgi:hypothetical protein
MKLDPSQIRAGRSRKIELSSSQRDLLIAMKGGVKVHFVSGWDAHAFRSDTMRRCTATIFALKRVGLVEEYKADWRGCVYRPTLQQVETP